MRLNERVTVDFEVDMNYGDDPGATINWSLRVEIRAPGGRQSKRSQQAEGLAHWSDFGSDATFGEALWEGRKGYGDGDPPRGWEIHEGCAARLIAALGMSLGRWMARPVKASDGRASVRARRAVPLGGRVCCCRSRTGV